MGTRADFYVGRGRESEWLGSIAWDGYPDGLTNDVKTVTDEAAWRSAVASFLGGREDATLPAQGWPWPWDNSQTTDYSYAFDAGVVWATNYGHGWWKATEEPPDDPPDDKVTFPDMTARQAVTLGKRSGVMVIGVNGPIDDLP